MKLSGNCSKENKTLEDVFQQINRDHVQINKEEKKYNNIVLRSVLQEILREMRSTDKLFASMNPRLDYLGSYYDGLRVGHATEFDINLILKLPINYGKISLDSAKTPYDYTNVIMPSEFRRLCKTPFTAKNGFTKTELWCDSSHRLSVKKFRSWMQSVVDSALNTMPKKANGRYCLYVNNKHYEISAKLSGPANTVTIYDNKIVIDVDLVPTFAFELPKIPNKCSVDFCREEFRCTKQYFVVPKPTQDEYIWRLTFPFQERMCMKSKNNFKSAIKLIKLLRDTQGFDKLASYFIKTVFLWEITEKKDEFWKKKSLSFIVLYMLKKLRDQLEMRTIKNFWCPESNLIYKLKGETCRNWCNRLTFIINEIERKQKDEPWIVEKYFTNKNYY